VSSPTAEVDRDADDPTTAAGQIRGRPLGERVLALSALATLAVATTTGLHVLYNVPVDPANVSADLLSAVGMGAAILVALALVAIALASTRSGVRIGFLFAGVFGMLATLSNAAAVPAVVAITGGAAVVLGPGLGKPSTYDEFRRRALGIAFLAAVGLSLASTTGVLDAGVRGTGSALFLVALTLLVVRTGSDPVALVAGLAGLAAVLAVSTSAPFVTGSALLIAFGVVGVPHLLAATAVFGGVAATVAGLRDSDYALVVGATLLLVAGVPASPAAAMAVCLGATLACADLESLLGKADQRATVSGVSDQ